MSLPTSPAKQANLKLFLDNLPAALFIQARGRCFPPPGKESAMRHPRIKPVGVDTFMHVYNRTVGSTVEFPFGDVEKEEFIRRVKALDRYYAIDVLAVTVLGNHFHAIIHVPGEPPTNEEAARRYSEHHDGKRCIEPDSLACTKLAMQLRDVSQFMAEVLSPVGITPQSSCALNQR